MGGVKERADVPTLMISAKLTKRRISLELINVQELGIALERELALQADSVLELLCANNPIFHHMIPKKTKYKSKMNPNQV